jgi:pimeloyl-ACP methyl ester carboxylesterase
MANAQLTTALPDKLRAAVRQASVRDAELRYVRTGSGRPVVLLHTLRTQLDMFGAVLERLDLMRIDAVAVDLPGHGHSGAPPVDYTAEYFSDTVEELLEHIDVQGALLVGESIGGTIALSIAARGNDRVAGVIAVNPYDYGRWGGIRRSSPLANALFTAIMLPGIGALVARAETRTILRAVLHGGLYDRSALRSDLLEELFRCGSLPGHARALQSLCRAWRSFVAARAHYSEIAVPVTLVYGEDDWSRPHERAANARAIPGVRVVRLERSGHFASLEQPEAIVGLISEAIR